MIPSPKVTPKAALKLFQMNVNLIHRSAASFNYKHKDGISYLRDYLFHAATMFHSMLSDDPTKEMNEAIRLMDYNLDTEKLISSLPMELSCALDELFNDYTAAQQVFLKARAVTMMTNANLNNFNELLPILEMLTLAGVEDSFRLCKDKAHVHEFTIHAFMCISTFLYNEQRLLNELMKVEGTIQ